MASHIRIKNITIKTPDSQATYPFEGPLTLITGSIGVGKSSLLELLKYGLGGTAKIMPAVKASVKVVQVLAEFSGRPYLFHREVGETKVDILDVTTGALVGPWSVTNRKYMPKASQRLLGLLGLPEDLRVPKRRVRPTSETVGISFFDLYRYIYLGQNEIDTSVVGHIDINLDNKRRAVFELLYGLNSPDLINLVVRKGELLEKDKKLRDRAEAVKEFLLQANEPDMDQLERLRSVAYTELESARELLAAVRSEGAALLESQRALRDRVSMLRSELTELSSGYDAISGDIHKSKSLLAHLRLEKEALNRANVAGRALSGLEFSVCPRCLQDLPTEPPPVGHCALCSQREEQAEEDISGESKRLAEQIAETEALLAEDEGALETRWSQMRTIEGSLAEATMELDRSTSDLISPRLEEVQALSMQIARLEAQIEKLEASEARWSNYGGTLDEAAEAVRRAGSLDEEEQELQAHLSANRVHLDELADVFNSMVSDLRLPWYESGDVDRRTFLPIVNGEQFDELSVGGARKTIVNLAYHLANLRYTVQRNDLPYPSLLIVDSPRKGVGQTAEDAAVAREVYQSLARLAEDFGHDIQLIVADNSVPPDVVADYPELHFTYEDPVVPGVRHPGEGVERVN